MLTRREFVAASMASTLRQALVQPVSARNTLIDSHVHVWKHDPALPFAEGASPPAEDATAEMLLELMRANHVTHTVLIQVIHYKWDNRYLASVLRRYPGLFQGVCRVDPVDPKSPDRLARLTEEEGFHGVRLSPTADSTGDWIRSPLMSPLWERCSRLRVPMTLLLPASRLPDIEPLIRANPDLQVVIDHMADVQPQASEQLDLLLHLAKYPHVFVKLSHLWSLSALPYPYRDMQRQVKSLNAAFGAKRLMWGTDWPICFKYLSYAKAVELYRDHLTFLPTQDREQILYKTVRRIWPFAPTH